MAEPSLNEIVAGQSDRYRAHLSPSGTYVLVTEAIEARNSQWVEHGTIYRKADGTAIAELGEWCWHVDAVRWTGDEGLELALRRFPGDAPGLTLRLELRQGHANLAGATGPLSELNERLEVWYLEHRQG